MRTVLRPARLDELFSLMERFPQAMLMAGGTDLLVRLRRELASPGHPLLLLGELPELRGIRDTGNELSIGAATPLASLLSDPLIAAHAPLLARAARTVGGPAIRNVATIGGNVCTASPAGDTLPPLHLLGAELELASPRGSRRLSISNFVAGPGLTRLGEREIITSILLPHAGDFPHQIFVKVGLRGSLAVAVVSFAALLRFSPDGRVGEARCAWGSAAPTVVRLPRLETFLSGAPLNRDTIGRAAHLVRDGVSPVDDIRATADYRRSVAANLLVRFLEELNV